MLFLMVLVGVAATAAQVRAVRRTTGELRQVWTFLALGASLISLSVTIGIYQFPIAQGTFLLRAIGMAALAYGLYLTPGFWRSPREWAPILLDGWICAASAFCVVWVCLTALGLPYGLSQLPYPASVLWVLIDIGACTVVLGLALRTTGRDRTVVALGSTYPLIGALGDSVWARSGNAPLTTLLAVLAVGAMGLASLAPGMNPWVSVSPTVVRPHPARHTHLVAVPGIMSAAALPTWDPLVLWHGGALIVAVVARLFVLDSVNVALWARLDQRASSDELTGLLNRAAFLLTLRSQLRVGLTTVYFFDLDGFKNINDLHGHAVGDAVLVRVATHLRNTIGHRAVCARLGGDEFAVMVPGPPPVPTDAATSVIARRIAADPACYGVSISVGLASSSGAEAEELLADADLAMYFAKTADGSHCARFEPWMREKLHERARVTAALSVAALTSPSGCSRVRQGAGPDSQLELAFLPVVRLAEHRISGYEALLRWRDGDQVRTPAEFLPLADDTGLACSLDTWTLRTALHWLAGAKDPGLGITVNASGSQVISPAFTDLVLSELDHAGIEPDRLTIDVTEQTPIHWLLTAHDVLAPLRERGVHIALDDFGTGGSSMGYLTKLPVDILKIDKSFVAGIDQRATDEAVVRSVLTLASELGLSVIAEGVETQAQFERLSAWGCTSAQGYFFAQHVPG